jgi:phage replication O-like protein O
VANPQPHPFIRISQELFEQMYQQKLSGAERAVLDFIIRVTWGFRRKQTRLTRMDFQRGIQKVPGLKLTERTINRAVDNLWKKNIITKDQIPFTHYANYAIQKDYDKWR